MLGMFVVLFIYSLLMAGIIGILNIGKQSDIDTAQCLYDEKLKAYQDGLISEEEFETFLNLHSFAMLEYGIAV